MFNDIFFRLIYELKKHFNFLVYVLVGVVSAVSDICSLYVASKVFNWNLALSVTIGFIVGLVVNYVLHSNITFKRKMEFVTFIKYLLVVAFNYILTLVLIQLLVSGLDLGLILSKIITLPVIAAVGYILSKAWIYQK
jgi:putative flippase GtrA